MDAFQVAGSQGDRPTRSAPIFTNRFITGLWTQRNPLRDAATQYLVEKFYTGARFESIIDGLNMELTNRLTIGRRCGKSVYNSQNFPAIARFAEFRYTLNGAEVMNVIADTNLIVYDATGPSTKAVILNKTAAATGSPTFFQGVGNTLYFGDRFEVKKWVKPNKTWTATTVFTAGDSVLDSNGRLQYASVVQNNVSTISQVQIKNNLLTLTVGATVPTSLLGQNVRISGVGTNTFLNNTYLTISSIVGSTLSGIFVHADVAAVGDTGTIQIFTGTGTSGSSTPTWATTAGATATDPPGGGLDGLIWTCAGFPTYNWGIAAPTAGPTIAGTTSGITFWRPVIAYTVPGGGTFIVDSNLNIQSLITAGITGIVPPTWAQNMGQVTSDPNGAGGAGWVNVGKASQGWTAGQVTPYSFSTVLGSYSIIDSNGNLQQQTTGGTTGTTQPTWATVVGTTTADNTVTWTCRGKAPVFAFGTEKWVYCYHTFQGGLSTASQFVTLLPSFGTSFTIGGLGSADPQCDQIWLFRTAANGSLYEFSAIIANPGAGAWSYADGNPDSALNPFQLAPINHVNDPPPTGLGKLTYHLGRVMGAVGNTLWFSAGPDTALGNGNECFPPSNTFQLPSFINKIVPLTQGMLIFTTSNCWYSPNSTDGSARPLVPAPYMDGKIAGLLSWDELKVVGSTIYMVDSTRCVQQFDIGAGLGEVGFPIGDLLKAQLNPAAGFLVWHKQDSTDQGLYVAQPGAAGVGFWYRMNPTPAPETGITWSTQAVSARGFSAMESIETSPGVHQLLFGPPSTTGPILFRDTTTNTDNGTAYTCFADIGSLVVAHPGGEAVLDFISTDCIAIGTRPIVRVLLGEIGGHAEIIAAGSLLNVAVPDPPNTPIESSTIYNDRWWMSASRQSASCRHLQIEFAFPAENFPNEILTYGLFGEHYQER